MRSSDQKTALRNAKISDYPEMTREQISSRVQTLVAKKRRVEKVSPIKIAKQSMEAEMRVFGGRKMKSALAED